MDNTSVKGELWREAVSWIKTIIFALIFAWLFTNFIIINAIVPTGSMMNTIRVNDRIIAFRLSYLFSEPERYDIIVFRPYDGGDLNVKRIIGMPGDELKIVDWRVYVNGVAVREDFVQSARGQSVPPAPFGNFPAPNHPGLGDYVTVPQDGGAPFITVPEGQFFVLGDYRDNSNDSRGGIGPRGGSLRTFVSQEQIRGKAIFRYFPGFKNLTR
ncbi:MAG: signal peptidase I [Defluviitaleaceae bacterium]|nr:signal peptidase I [Defluviitaleaceae bacterium]MCL2263115.1 signal peptidase I [Defluviitaleaceae bacterium]